MIGPTTVPPKPPQEQLDKMFDDVLKHMDLPVDKLRILRGYDNDKKWKLIVDQQVAKQVTPPAKYLEKLSYFLDKKC
uniref:Drf_GBD domain-containing protein n=1 Tax=Caenorhabditis tropicalis TaxID=1561998 RepID=A0A1I7UWY0_9PELO